MITARKILEEYETIVRLGSYRRADVFVNPSRKEIMSCGDEIRFTADADKKKIYVWNGEFFIHDNVNPKIGYGEKWFNKPILTGLAKEDSPVYYAYESQELESLDLRREDKRNILIKILSSDWSWSNRYVDLNDLLILLAAKFKKEVSVGDYPFLDKYKLPKRV